MTKRQEDHLPAEVVQELAELRAVYYNPELPADERERALQRAKRLQRHKVQGVFVWDANKIAVAIKGLRRVRRYPEREWLAPLISALEDIQYPGERVIIELVTELPRVTREHAAAEEPARWTTNDNIEAARIDHLLALHAALRAETEQVNADFEARYGFAPFDLDQAEAAGLHWTSERWNELCEGRAAFVAFEAAAETMPPAERRALADLVKCDVPDMPLSLLLMMLETRQGEPAR